mgnify:CR=1 FL=1
METVTRVQTHSLSERDGSGKCDDREEVLRELVAAVGNAAEVREPAGHGLDPPSVPIVPDRPVPINTAKMTGVVLASLRVLWKWFAS